MVRDNWVVFMSQCAFACFSRCVSVWRVDMCFLSAFFCEWFWACARHIFFTSRPAAAEQSVRFWRLQCGMEKANEESPYRAIWGGGVHSASQYTRTCPFMILTQPLHVPKPSLFQQIHKPTTHWVFCRLSWFIFTFDCNSCSFSGHNSTKRTLLI